MNLIGFLGAVLFGVGINEFCDISPWAARKIVRWSAYRKYTEPERADIRAEELAALIDDRPGKTLKLVTAFGYVGAMIADSVWRWVGDIVGRETDRTRPRTSQLIPDRDLPKRLDTAVPSVSRMYDYFLDGKDHFEVDRRRAEQVIEHFPQVRAVARANRAFLGAAVRTAAEAGVVQFIDLGAGLPSQGHVHEVARPIRPDTRVVYVDIDPVACAHARALLPDDATAVVNADIRTPRTILEDPAVGRLIDWSKPVALLLVSVLHFITDEEDPAGIIDAFARRMTSGSHLVLSVASGDDHVDAEGLINAYQGSGASAGGLRSREQIGAFFAGFPLIPPGLVDVHDWPTPAAHPRSDSAIHLLAAVGRRP